MTRQIILDTETTGLSPNDGHRIIEIGCIELNNRQRTYQDFHSYFNPHRAIDVGAQAVHGITQEFLADKPRFSEMVKQLLDYLSGAELVIHNAAFDVGFLNYELKRAGANFESLSQYCTVFDTLEYARKKHAGQRNSLDALCKRYGVDNTNRTLHGALLDAELLTEVYLAMTGGQASLLIELEPVEANTVVHQDFHTLADLDGSSLTDLIVIPPNAEEQAAHECFIALLLEKRQRVDNLDAAFLLLA